MVELTRFTHESACRFPGDPVHQQILNSLLDQLQADLNFAYFSCNSL